MCLFQCGPNRINNEWTQYMNSFTNDRAEGGGGWSQIKFSLESLYEQQQLLRNKWTQSNVLMPLCRYTGCKLKLYRNYDVDYICHYSICTPMLDTVYQHTNAQPNNMLLYRKKILVPCKKNNPRAKPYVKKRIRPPETFQNKWYFQKDLNKQPLLLLTTTATDFNRFYLNPIAKSNNITLTFLNTSLFGNPNFENYPQGTNPWQIKRDYYLYATINGEDDPLGSSLIFLGQTKAYTLGKPLSQFNDWQTYSRVENQHENFGNPFHADYMTHTRKTYIGKTSPMSLFANANYKTQKASKLGIALNTQPFYTHARYTPERDKGDTNKIYLLKTSTTTYSWDPPGNKNVEYDGFPLWCLLWGWIDWQIKLGEYSKILENTMLVIQTKETYKEFSPIVLLDKTFIDGYSPYQQESEYRTPEDSISWHPKVKHQQIEIDNICKTGPGTIKTNKTSIEAHLNYSFYFKWGGCPNDLENITDPADQPKYPTPNNQLQKLEITDPGTDPKHTLWPCDIRRHMLTAKAAKRIKTISTPEKITFTGTTLQLPPTKKMETQDQTSSEEETETNQEQQLKQLRHRNKHLRQQLCQLISQIPNIKY